MNRCAAITNAGGRCSRYVNASKQYCYAHDPERGEERKRNAAKAGSVKTGPAEIQEIKREIRRIGKDVEKGDIQTGRASLMIQGLGSLRYFIELERRIKEPDELEQRLEQLDGAQPSGGGRGPRGGRTWPR